MAPEWQCHSKWHVPACETGRSDAISKVAARLFLTYQFTGHAPVNNMLALLTIFSKKKKRIQEGITRWVCTDHFREELLSFTWGLKSLYYYTTVQSPSHTVQYSHSKFPSLSSLFSSSFPLCLVLSIKPRGLCWIWIQCIAQVSLKLSILLPHLPSAGVTGMHACISTASSWFSATLT